MVFERFDDEARHVVVWAQEEARRLNHDHIGTEHLLIALLRPRHGAVVDVLESEGINPDLVRGALEELLSKGPAAPQGHIPFTDSAKATLELSLREALKLGHGHVGPEHVLLGLLREGKGTAARVLNGLGADLNRTRQAVSAALTEGRRAARGETGIEIGIVPEPSRELDVVDRLSAGALAALATARAAATALGHARADVAHVLLAVATEAGLEAGQVRALLPAGQRGGSAEGFTPQAKAVLALALDVGGDDVGPRHLLRSVLEAGGVFELDLLRRLEVDPGTLLHALREEG